MCAGTIRGELNLTDLGISPELLLAAYRDKVTPPTREKTSERSLPSRGERRPQKKEPPADVNASNGVEGTPPEASPKESATRVSLGEVIRVKGKANSTLVLPDNWTLLMDMPAMLRRLSKTRIMSRSSASVDDRKGRSPREILKAMMPTAVDDHNDRSPRETPGPTVDTLVAMPLEQNTADARSVPAETTMIDSTLVTITQVGQATSASSAGRQSTLLCDTAVGVAPTTMVTRIEPPVDVTAASIPLVEPMAPPDVTVSNASTATAEKKTSLKRIKDTPAVAAFAASLAAEHLDDVVFLFSQCIHFSRDPSYRWGDAAAAEARLSSHISALSFAEHGTLSLLFQAFEDADAGRSAGAALVLMNLFGDLALPQVVDKFISMEAPLLSPLETALARTACPGVTGALLPLMATDRPELRSAAASVLSFRGELVEGQLIALFGNAYDPELAAALSDDLAKLPKDFRALMWQKMLRSDADSTKRAAVVDMLKAHREEGIGCLLDLLRTADAKASWMLACLTLCGGEYAFEQLIPYLNDDALCVAAIHGLGRLGNPSAVDTLLDVLNRECDAVREAAGEALNRITGADLRQPIRRGDSPESADNEDADIDETEFCISTCPSTWAAWWAAHRDRFEPRRCYRNGDLFTFRHCISEMADENALSSDRQNAYLELVIRADVEIPFKTGWPMEKQQQTIDRLWDWWQEQGARFVSGGWHFGAERIM